MSEYPSYLIHYGIEGQKWGIRRYQNEDGTYTSEGLERRKILDNAPSKEGYKQLKKSYKQNVKGSTKEFNQVRKESGRDKLIQKREKTNAAIEKVDNYAYKRAAELFDEYKDLKLYKAKLKGKDFDTSKVAVQSYFDSYGFAPDIFTNTPASITYIAATDSNNKTKITKYVFRTHVY